MIPTEGWDFFLDAGDGRRFCSVTLYSTDGNQDLVSRRRGRVPAKNT
jgi:hypothetical protein